MAGAAAAKSGGSGAVLGSKCRPAVPATIVTSNPSSSRTSFPVSDPSASGGRKRPESSRPLPRPGLVEVVGAGGRTRLMRHGGLRDLVGAEGAAGDFDHRADSVVQFRVPLDHNLFDSGLDEFGLKIQSTLEADERDHDFGLHFDAGFRDFGGGCPAAASENLLASGRVVGHVPGHEQDRQCR